MKTTVDLPDQLLREARREAARRATTVRALVEAGLRRELRPTSKEPDFRLRDATFRGRGLRADARGLSWEALREMAYGGHGG